MALSRRVLFTFLVLLEYKLDCRHIYNTHMIYMPSAFVYRLLAGISFLFVSGSSVYSIIICNKTISIPKRPNKSFYMISDCGVSFSFLWRNLICYSIATFVAYACGEIFYGERGVRFFYGEYGWIIIAFKYWLLAIVGLVAGSFSIRLFIITGY